MPRTFLLVASALLVALASRAQAQTAPGASPSAVKRPVPSADRVNRDAARRHFEQGVALYEEGNFPGALAEFEAAHQASPATAVLYNIGLTYKALFRYTESIETLNRYLAETATDKKVPPQRRSQVQQLIAEMRGLLAPVTFQIMPRTAGLLLDGRQSKLPDDATLNLPAGKHVAEISADGYRPERREFTVAGGTPLTLEVTLVAIPRAGLVRISSSQPGTRIRIDAKDVGVAPLELELLAGGHQLEASSEGFETQRSELVVAAGQERNVDLEMQLPSAVRYGQTPVYKKWWFWSAIATAVAGGTTAALLARPGVEPSLRGSLFPSALDLTK